MRNKKQVIGVIWAVVAGMVLFSVILAVWLWVSDRNLTLEKIAYDTSWREPVVYIKENGEYVPYLVLTSNYDGNVLLLRKNVLPQEMQYEPASVGSAQGALSGGWVWYDYGSYYEKSSIDKFLSMDFPKVFSQNVQAAIVDTTIEVTDLESFEEEHWAEATHMIERKVFLLSAAELGVTFGFGYTMAKEGKALTYFKKGRPSAQKAYKANGEAWTYWTRTPRIGETCIVTAMGINYEIVGATADATSGVRPAFCLEKGTAVEKRDDIIAGESVYTLALDNDNQEE